MACLLGWAWVVSITTARADWIFAGHETNDLYQTAKASGLAARRVDTPAAAVAQAKAGDGILILADDYPARQTPVPDDVYQNAAARKLRLYVEYPAALPDTKIGAPRKMEWERAVVTSDAFGPTLAKMRILMIQDCSYLPNESYGTGECPLVFESGDPATDLLYTSNFAFLGLHEAAAATGDDALKRAVDRIADFMIRIQVRSDQPAVLDGAWFRGFDFSRWDYWGSNADIGWGVWATESGWTQGWITSMLALRQMNTSYWDITKKNGIAKNFAALRKSLLPDEMLVSRIQVNPQDENDK